MQLISHILTLNLKKSLGIIIILASSCLYALTHVISKPLVEANSQTEINPLILVFIVYIINGIFFTPFAKYSGCAISKVGHRNLVIIFGIGLAELIGMIMYFVGLKDSTAVNAAIFDNTEIIFALLIAIIIFRDRLKPNELLPFFLIIFGVIVLPIAYDISQHGIINDLLIGDILIIFSGLFLAIDVNLYRFVSSRVSSHRIMQLYSLFGGLCSLGLILSLDIPIIVNWEQIVPITLVTIFGVGLPALFFLMAIRLIGAVKTIIVYSTTSVFGLLFASVILGETFTIIHGISTLTVIAGVYMLRKRLAINE